VRRIHPHPDEPRFSLPPHADFRRAVSQTLEQRCSGNRQTADRSPASIRRLQASRRAPKRRKAFLREVIGRCPSVLPELQRPCLSAASTVARRSKTAAKATNVRERSPKFRQRISHWQDSHAQNGHSEILRWKPACAGVFGIDFSVR